MSNFTRHWQQVYEQADSKKFSWFQPQTRSINLIRKLNIQGPIIDVGSGTSRFIDELLRAGHRDITAVDISSVALLSNQQRLEQQQNTQGVCQSIEWHQADVCQLSMDTRFALWHDRAVLHFLLERHQQQQYVTRVKHHVLSEGHVIIWIFAHNGPTRCSGLPVYRHDQRSITELFDGCCHLVAQYDEVHVTPAGKEQLFTGYHLQRI